MECELRPKCPTFDIRQEEQCDKSVCRLYSKIHLDKTVDETIKELGLRNEDIEVVLKRMHSNYNLRREWGGSFSESYAKFFRQEAFFYIEQE